LNWQAANYAVLLCWRRAASRLGRSTGELHQFGQLTRAVPVAGALSLGEIGSSLQWGYPLFHKCHAGGHSLG